MRSFPDHGTREAGAAPHRNHPGRSSLADRIRDTAQLVFVGDMVRPVLYHRTPQLRGEGRDKC